LQLTFARSKDPVVQMDLSITRVAITNESDEYTIKEGEGENGKPTYEGKQSEMGRKAIVPYGLYRGHGFYNPTLGAKTGFSADDLALFWQALQMCWDLDRSASRGMMALRRLYVFSHDHKLGSAPAHVLFEQVAAEQDAAALDADGLGVPRRIGHYAFTTPAEGDLPDGVTLTTLVE
jgi:CRISPR-associated protein Csd2